MRQMEEEKQRETEESPEETGQAGDADSPLKKKKKKDKKPIKSMTKEERQKRSEELKTERKAKALQWKKAKEEKEQEKNTVVRAEDVPSNLESLPEPSTSRQTDPLETSLIESGPQLVNFDPFEGEEEPTIHPTSTEQPESYHRLSV